MVPRTTDVTEGQKTVTIQESIEKVHDIVLDDSRVKVCQIAKAVGMSEKKYSKHVAQRIRDAKGLRKVGAAFAECRSKTNVKQLRCSVWIDYI